MTYDQYVHPDMSRAELAQESLEHSRSPDAE